MKQTKKLISFLLAAVMILSMLPYAALSAFADDAEKPVWAYHSGQSTTYAKYNTVYEAVNSTNLRDNDVLEFHGDVTETITTQFSITKNVTILSEDNVSHTWSFQSNTYGVRVNQANKTVTIGGGTGEGALIVDNNGTCGFFNVAIGTLVINDRTIITECAVQGNTSGGPILVSKREGSGAPKLYINGGIFRNNQSNGTSNNKDGGVITNIGGIVYLNGGTFEGNQSISGHGNAIYNDGVLRISGSPVFAEDQDIYLRCMNDALHLSYSENAIIKDGPIGSSNIPITVGTDTSLQSVNAFYEGRDILQSGAEPVNENDLSLFAVRNNQDLKQNYKTIGYTKKDSVSGKKVLELIPEITDNFDNFINNDYNTPIETNPSRSKTAKWLNDEKTQAEIDISIDDGPNKPDGSILVIGGLCHAHGLNGETIANAINSLAQSTDVEYYFASVTCAASSQFKSGIEGTMRGPYSGIVEKGHSITQNSFGTGGTMYSGAHISGYMTARKLVDALQSKNYRNIILCFDNFDISAYPYYAYTLEEQQTFYQAANLLKPYYEKNQVIWISAAKHIVGIDYDTGASITQETMTEMLGRGPYSTNEKLYHYEVTHTTLETAGKYDKFCNFFNMALFDPLTWLDGVDNNTIPEWEDYDLNVPGVLYANASDVSDYIDAWVNHDTISILDTVDPDLPINHVIVEVSRDGGETWTDITEETGVTVNINNQDVECIIADTEYFYLLIRMRIICDCPGEFETPDGAPKDTNIGDAFIQYYYNGVLNESHHLLSPTLYKDLLSLTVTKTVTGVESEAQFPFELTVLKSDDSIPDFTSLESDLPTGVSLKSETTNVFCFNLAQNETVSISDVFPVGTKITLSELSHDKYDVSMVVNSNQYSGDSQSFAMSADITIQVINDIQKFYVVHHIANSDGTINDDYTEAVPVSVLDYSGKFDITQPITGCYNGIREGYIYGGMYVGDHDNDEYTTTAETELYGKELEPQVGMYYYLREVSEEYLQPAVISVRRKPWDDSVEHFLLTALDKDGAGSGFYTWYGFAYDTTVTGSGSPQTISNLGNVDSKTDKIRPGATEEFNDSMSCCLYKQIDLYYWGKFEKTWKPNDVFFPVPEFNGNGVVVAETPTGVVSADDYFGCMPVNTDYVSDDEIEFTFVPYYVTADGVLVTGTTVRTTDYSSQASQTWTQSEDTAVASYTCQAPAALSSAPRRLPVAHSMSTLSVSEEAPIKPQLVMTKPANMKQAVSQFAARRFIMVRGIAPASCTITTMPCRLSVLVYLR